MWNLISRPLQSFWPLGLLTFLSSLLIIQSLDKCSDPPENEFAKPDLEGRTAPFPLNTTIAYTCERGYLPPSNPLIAQCVMLKNGTATWAVTWSEPSLSCHAVSCNFPGDVTNGRIIGNVYSFPNNVTYICDPGYILKGRAVLYCNPSGQWTGRLPSCEIVHCPDLNNPVNGTVTYISRTFNSKAEYSCNSGFKQIKVTRHCQENGTWSGDVPQCEEIRCPDLSGIPGSNIYPANSSRAPGELIIFECIEQTDIKLSLKCLPQGIWTSDPPDCSSGIETLTIPKTVLTTIKPGTGQSQILCDDPGDIKNGHRKYDTEFNSGSTLTYYCQKDYVLRGTQKLVCLETGKWSSDKLPICVKPLPLPIIIGISIGGFVILSLIVAFLWYFCWRKRKFHSPGMKNKASPSDASDLDEIRRLENKRKPIPVTTL